MQDARTPSPHDARLDSARAVYGGNRSLSNALLHTALLVRESGYRKWATGILAAVAGLMGCQPTGFGRMLCALDLYLGPTQEIVLVGEPGTQATEALVAEARRRYLPNAVLALRRPGEAA